MLTFLGILGVIGIVGICIRIAWPILKFLGFIVGIGVIIGMGLVLLIF